MSDHLLVEKNIRLHIGSSLPKFPWTGFSFCGGFRTARANPMLLFCLLLSRCYARLECCCCWLYQFFLNVAQSASPGVSSLTTPRCHVNHDCKWFCLPEFRSLILRLWQSYPIHCIQVIVRTSQIKYTLCDQIDVQLTSLLLIPGNDFPCESGSLVWNKFNKTCPTLFDVKTYPSFVGTRGNLAVCKTRFLEILDDFRTILCWISFLLHECELHS